MKKKKPPLLKDLGERAVIKHLCRGLPPGENVVLGPGDDCAIVRHRARSREDLLLTSDAVIEGIHFTTDMRAPRIGYKLMARAVSDIAAMGGTPQWALLDLVAPPPTPLKLVEDIYMGARWVANAYNVGIVGGDTASGPILELHVFLVGTAPRDRAVQRQGAQHNDIIFVTGTLGGSILRKHLRFEPRIREGIFLRRWATSMIDISDGLVTDLYHLTDRSFTGARLDLRKIPVSKDARLLKDRRSPLDHALYDGEDFELLFTVPEIKAPSFAKAWKKHFELRCTAIGQMSDLLCGVECTTENGKVKILERAGYQHFKK